MTRVRLIDLPSAGTLALSALVISLPLFRGGVTWPVQLAAAAISPVALWMSGRGSGRIPLLAVALGAVVGLMALQLVPWPPTLHGVSASTQAVFVAVLQPLGLYPASRPLSLDPAETGLALARATAGLCALWAAWSVGAGQRRRRLLLGALGFSGVTVALVALGAALFGASPLLAPTLPFVNRNHLAGFLDLTSFVVLGLALRARGQSRILWLTGFIATTAVVFLTLSRGGLIAFGLGGLLFFALSGRREHSEHVGAPRWRAVSLAGIATAIGLAGYLALDPVLERLASLRNLEHDSKLALLMPALDMVREHPWVGIGRGAFGAAFTGYKTDPIAVTFTHLENEWVEPVAELGIPAGLLLVGSLFATWAFLAVRRDLGWSEVGLLAGIAAVAAQGAVDFSLDFVGVGVPFMVAIGLAMRGRFGISTARGAVTVAAASALALGVAGGAVWWSRRPPGAGWEANLMPDEAATRARAIVLWRPADYLPHAVVGGLLVEDGRCAEGIPWLQRAMLLNPTAPEPHLMVARCLAASGQGPLARREYRLAFVYGNSTAISEAMGLYPGISDLFEVAPDTPAGLMALGSLLEAHRPADAALAYGRAMESFGESQAAGPMARALLAAGEADRALTFARSRTSQAPSDTEAWRVAAAALLAAGDEDGALAEARRGLALNPGAIAIHRFLVDRAIAARRPAEAGRLASEIVPKSPREQLTKELTIAHVLALQGRLGEAIERVRSATYIVPGDLNPLLALAAYCERAERYDDAIAAVEHIMALPGQDPSTYQAQLARLRSARADRSARRGR